MPAPQVQLRGMRELSRAFAHADRDARKLVRSSFREVAQPVKRDAEALAQQHIPRVGNRWWKMRIGVTQRAVYVAPRQRGVRSGRDPRSRPNFAPLLMGRAMEPALDRNTAEIEHAVERALDHMADNFNRGGHL